MDLMEWEVGIPGKAGVSVTCVCVQRTLGTALNTFV